jgi:hypothetical protein
MIPHIIILIYIMPSQWDDLTKVVMNYTSIIPVYIAFFMIMTSAFNQDGKAWYWLFCVIIGVGLIKTFFEKTASMFNQPLAYDKFTATLVTPDVTLFNNYPNCSISAFIIMFTLIYLIMSMTTTNDWNYWVITLFVTLYLVDVVYSKHFIPLYGRFIGTMLGAVYGIICYFIAKKIAPDKLLYFTVDASNRKYCSRPKKQQFKCFVYKGGQLISST